LVGSNPRWCGGYLITYRFISCLGCSRWKRSMLIDATMRLVAMIKSQTHLGCSRWKRIMLIDAVMRLVEMSKSQTHLGCSRWKRSMLFLGSRAALLRC